MNIWQADFYYFPTQTETADRQWELTIASSSDRIAKPIYTAKCAAADANAAWLEKQISLAANGKLPDKIQVFRPQALGLISLAASKLGIEVEATRNTEALKRILRDKYSTNLNYNPFALEKTPPQPLPEDLWGDRWQIANIAAGQIVELFRDRPIPINSIPESFHPLNLNLGSDLFIPGMVVYGGKKSMQLAQWIARQNPAFINYIPTEIGKSGGFVLETGLAERWVFNTFESERAAEIAKSYEQKKQAAKGLHFLLIQPDDSGMTTTAFWLLKESNF